LVELGAFDLFLARSDGRRVAGGGALRVGGRSGLRWVGLAVSADLRGRLDDRFQLDFF